MILSESTRAERVAYLTRLLMTSREITTNEMALQMEVTPRTIQRDLAEIARVLPIYHNAGVWFYLEETGLISPY